ncbi:MAG: hypothetical protein EOO77_20805 [Oxalobacteraceae bacterium]|nr:MAG: hypothetical protein EOO77_20805 [Oxalobacteraceae bacterium]
MRTRSAEAGGLVWACSDDAQAPAAMTAAMMRCIWMLLTTGTRARTAHPIDASGLGWSQGGVGIAADECGVGNGRQRGTGRASHAGQRVGIRRAHVMRVAAAMMMRIPFVGVASDLIAVAIDVRRGFILARLDAAANLSRMRHPDPCGQDKH